MKRDLLYYWKYYGINHADAATRTLQQPDLASQINEYIKYYPLLANGGRIYTRLPDGSEETKVYCSCATCRENPENFAYNIIFDGIYKAEWERVKGVLASAPNFETKTRLWVQAGLNPFTNYVLEEDSLKEDWISIIPEDASLNESYNRFVYQYLTETDSAIISKLALGARIADFEGKMSRTLYPDRCLEQAKKDLHAEFGKVHYAGCSSTFNKLVAGDLIDWSTVTWRRENAMSAVQAHEGYRFLQYLEHYPVVSIRDHFGPYAAAVFADPKRGLQWDQISRFFVQKAAEFQVNIPYAESQFPADGGIQTAATGFIKNLESFPKSVYYVILRELATANPETANVKEFSQRLQSLFGPLSQMYGGLSRDLLNDVLIGLGVFPKAADAFRQGIELVHGGKDYRSALDNFRFSMECFLKNLLNNNAPLEKQREKLGAYLKDKHVPLPMREMIWTTIDLYSKYNNDHVKHDNKVMQDDVNTVLYLTATYLHRLLKTLL